MTSFELFNLLTFEKKNYISYIFILFSLEIYYMCQVTSIHEKNSNILHHYGIITSVIIKLCKKAVEKRKWAGLQNLICINFKYL